MFSGLIDEIGVVDSFESGRDGRLIKISCSKVLEDAAIGDSIAVDGTCLTVEILKENSFTGWVSRETVERTTLSTFRKGRKVNLEAAMRASDRFGGHMVQGHVEAIGAVRDFRQTPGDNVLTVEIPAELTDYMIEKGSVALDGVSLTIAKVNGKHVDVALIPGTIERTSIREWKPGRQINIESDVIGRYVLSYLKNTERGAKKLTMENLERRGF